LQPIASKLVKEIALYGGKIGKFVAATVEADVVTRVTELGLKGER
jgi:pantetheine-phosphate adenylyltransferase